MDLAPLSATLGNYFWKPCLMGASAPGRRNRPLIQHISEVGMRKEPSGADAIFVVVCLLVVAACFVALMVDLSHGMLREMLAILSLRQ